MQDDTRELLKLRDLLPLGGEDRLEIFTDGGELNLDIFYETRDAEPRAAKLRLHFPYAPFFVKTPFPGYSIIEDISTEINNEDITPLFLDSLVEYKHSIMLNGLQKSSEKYGFKSYTGYKHYRLFLHSVGVALHVIADSCEISNEFID